MFFKGILHNMYRHAKFSANSSIGITLLVQNTILDLQNSFIFSILIKPDEEMGRKCVSLQLAASNKVPKDKDEDTPGHPLI